MISNDIPADSMSNSSKKQMNDLFGRDGKRPTLGTDCVIFTKRQDGWYVLLIERGHEPYKGKWALPGGFMEWNESCEQSAARELQEETLLQNVDLKLVGVFSKPGRDPRGTIVSVAFWGVVNEKSAALAAHGDDAANHQWFAINQLPELAFDHLDILASAKQNIDFL